MLLGHLFFSLVGSPMTSSYKTIEKAFSVAPVKDLGHVFFI